MENEKRHSGLNDIGRNEDPIFTSRIPTLEEFPLDFIGDSASRDDQVKDGGEARLKDEFVAREIMQTRFSSLLSAKDKDIIQLTQELANNIAELKKVKADSQKYISILESRNQSLTESLRDLDLKEKNSMAKMDDVSAQIGHLSTLNTEIESKLKAKTKEFAEIEKRYRDLEAQNGLVTKELMSRINNLLPQVKRLQGLEENYAIILADKHQFEKRNKDQEETITYLREQIKELRSELKCNLDEFKEYKTEADQKEKDLKESYLREYDRFNKILIADRTTLEKENKGLKETVARIERQLQSYEFEVIRVKDEKKDLEFKLKKIGSQIREQIKIEDVTNKKQLAPSIVEIVPDETVRILKQRISSLEFARSNDARNAENVRQEYLRELDQLKKDLQFTNQEKENYRLRYEESEKVRREKESSFYRFEEEVRTIRPQLETLKEQNENLSFERIKVAELYQINHRLTEEKETLERQVVELKSKGENLVDEVNKFKALLEYNKSEVTDSMQSLREELICQKQSFEKIIIGKEKEIEDLRLLNGNKASWYDSEKERFQKELADAHHSFSAERETLGKKLRESVKQIEDTSEELNKVRLLLDYEKANASENLVNLEKKLEASKTERTQVLNLKEKEIEQMKAKLAQMQELIIEKDNLISVVSDRCQDLRERQAQLEKNQLEKNESLKVIELHLQQESKGLEIERNKMRSEVDLLNQERVALENRISLLSQQEKRLQHYVKAVNHTNVEVIEHLQALSEEYQSASQLHPLQDFLSAIENELKRNEMQLRKTPTVSVDRTRLERTVESLVEQQEFIREIIRERQVEMSRKLELIHNLVERAKHNLLPPPPPRLPSL